MREKLDDRRDRTLRVRMNAHEWDDLIDLMDIYGLTASGVVRHLLHKATLDQSDTSRLALDALSSDSKTYFLGE